VGAKWYELKTGRFFNGGQTIQTDAPYTDIPIFVKEGSIIPFGPAIQYTTEKNADPIRLYVYTGADGSFTLYEDENVNYNYEKGAFSLVPFRYSEKADTLTIGSRQGDFPGMLKERTFEITWVSQKNPVGLNLDSRAVQSVHYNGSKLVISRK
jgi:alpha-D-xyloside xylohydrolase